MKKIIAAILFLVFIAINSNAQIVNPPAFLGALIPGDCIKAVNVAQAEDAGAACGTGSGNVSGPGSSTSGDIASFNGTGGNTLQDSGVLTSSLVAQTNTTWTPRDESSASLTFSSVSANYTKIGNMVFIYCVLTYPSTADGSVAGIAGFPVSVANQAYATVPAIIFQESILAGGAMIYAGRGTTHGFITDLAGNSIINSTLSGKTISFILIYPAS